MTTTLFVPGLLRASWDLPKMMMLFSWGGRDVQGVILADGPYRSHLQTGPQPSGPTLTPLVMCFCTSRCSRTHAERVGVPKVKAFVQRSDTKP